jgi:hypothetical protein
MYVVLNGNEKLDVQGRGRSYFIDALVSQIQRNALGQSAKVRKSALYYSKQTQS